MVTPVIIAVMALTNTAPAATSLAFLAEGCIPSVNELTISSMAVFVSSKDRTKPMVVDNAKSSISETLNQKAKTRTKKAIKKWIFKLGSSLKAVQIPSKAFLKDKIRLFPIKLV